MIVYQSTKKQFLIDAANGIEDIILDSVSNKLGMHVQINGSEYNSWKNSLGNYMFHVMNVDEIADDVNVAIEYSIPRTKNRIDFIITGLDENNEEKVIIIELKQWSNVCLTTKDAVVTTRFSSGEIETNHPSYQAWSYSTLLNNFNEVVYSEGIDLIPCAYLHNHQDDDTVTNNFYLEYLQKAPLFCKGEKEKLQKFITRYVKKAGSKELLYRIDSGNVRPSKELADSLVSMMLGNKEFVLIDDQKLVYETALDLMRRNDGSQKEVFIVEGGPGTGKSVVAINLLVTAIQNKQNAHYVTKNAAPRAVFEAKLTGSMTKTKIHSLFQSSGAYVQAENNEIDVLIVDEAHRLNEKSGIFSNLGENQVKELIHAAKTSIFFIDEDQRVTWKDIGESAIIEEWAKKLGANITRAKLQSQFRCNGSDGYLAWLDHVLEIKETANTSLRGISYDFRVFDSPSEMRDAIVERNSKNKARIVAGYCWDWVSKKNKSLADIEFPEYNFAMQWNLTDDGSTYLIAPNSINQVGCIHTCQGLELEYVGVIIGKDLLVRNSRIVTDPRARAKSDKSLNGYQRDLKAGIVGTEAKADLLIKNTYRTLMTRGMKGCYIFCEEVETREYFKSRIGNFI
ncbi:MAG: DUF2075 domain-containing protein [Microgenomates group bacterium]